MIFLLCKNILFVIIVSGESMTNKNSQSNLHNKPIQDIRQRLVNEINNYLQSGGSLHISRKKLPFYRQLNNYANILKQQGLEMSHEEIMKGLGFKNYSDTYFRCIGIFELKKYKDENGYVDSYRKNPTLKSYIYALGNKLNLPNYLVVTLLADENLAKCRIDVEYIQYIKTELHQYIKEYGSLKGIKHNNSALYDKFRILIKYYGDGGELDLTTSDWLNVFELNDADNNFQNRPQKTIDIIPIIEKLKQEFGNKPFSHANLLQQDYDKVLLKSVKLGIPLKELFRNYGLNYMGLTTNRLSSTQVYKIPYLQEMRALRDNWLQAYGYTLKNGYCEEEILEAKVHACQYAYNKYKDKMFNFTLEKDTEKNVTNK